AGPEARVRRSAARTTCMSRPAEPARQSCHARIMYRSDAWCAAPALLAAAWRSRMPPYVSCPRVLPDRRRSLGSGLLGHRRGGVFLPVAPQRAVVFAGVPQILRVLDQVLEDHLPVEVHAKREVRRRQVAERVARAGEPLAQHLGGVEAVVETLEARDE